MPYRWLEHTSELELSIEADTADGVFAEALTALAELLGDGAGGREVTHELSIAAPDLAALLVEWMNELVYLSESEGLVPERVVRLELGDASLDAEIAGRRSAPQSLVKAVTYHHLEMGPAGNGWRARVVLDV